MTDHLIFTSKNLLENLARLGPWSQAHLGSVALAHYFPSEYTEGIEPAAQREAELCESLGCPTWGDLIWKFHTEVGFEHFDPAVVNER